MVKYPAMRRAEFFNPISVYQDCNMKSKTGETIALLVLGN